MRDPWVTHGLEWYHKVIGRPLVTHGATHQQPLGKPSVIHEGMLADPWADCGTVSDPWATHGLPMS